MRSTTGAAVMDASCLLCLLHLDITLELDLLPKLVLRYNTIFIPKYVREELDRKRQSRHQLRKLLKQYTFFKECSVANEVDARLLYDHNLIPTPPLDRGEAEAIIQARERGITDVLIDERKGRLIAQRLTLNARGVLNLLAEFKKMKVIQEAKPLVDKLIKDLRFRIEDKLLRQWLVEIGEA